MDRPGNRFRRNSPDDVVARARPTFGRSQRLREGVRHRDLLQAAAAEERRQREEGLGKVQAGLGLAPDPPGYLDLPQLRLGRRRARHRLGSAAPARDLLLHEEPDVVRRAVLGPKGRHHAAGHRFHARGRGEDGSHLGPARPAVPPQRPEPGPARGHDPEPGLLLRGTAARDDHHRHAARGHGPEGRFVAPGVGEDEGEGALPVGGGGAGAHQDDVRRRGCGPYPRCDAAESRQPLVAGAEEAELDEGQRVRTARSVGCISQHGCMVLTTKKQQNKQTAHSCDQNVQRVR
mmetsp:Transcript_62019/g.162550  ORF Transcript_62019/g.162550 Transcript_62019/m.162550 type:complete len:290 (-) Transcript_62019:208-1077(-)